MAALTAFAPTAALSFFERMSSSCPVAEASAASRPVERAGDGLLFHREDALFGLEPGGPAHALDPLLGLLDALAHERPIALLGEALVLRADLGAARFALGADLGALGLRVRPDAGGHFFDPVHGSPNLADQAPLNRC